MYEAVGKMKSPRLIKSHFPGQMLPPDIMSKKARIVYVARNPKDLAVSYYYFTLGNPAFRAYKTWDEFFNDYYSGNGEFKILVYFDTYIMYYFFFKTLVDRGRKPR